FMEGNAKMTFIDNLKIELENNEELQAQLLQIVNAVGKLPSVVTGHMEELAKLGWFPTEFGYFSVMIEVLNEEGVSALNEYMFSEIDEEYLSIKNKVLMRHANRREILDCAFSLHEQGNWIASIPLFLSQIEGIFSENVGSMLFSEHDKRKTALQDNFSEEYNDNKAYLFNHFTDVKLQFSARISSKSEAKKQCGPNRNGILHGSRKHLDYGTKINSYKCISLLSNVSMTFGELCSRNITRR
ncbi:hypothetical protein ACWOVX_004447, partial [Vibrio vulnificus]